LPWNQFGNYYDLKHLHQGKIAVHGVYHSHEMSDNRTYNNEACYPVVSDRSSCRLFP
jgi:hypothetical protein